MQTVRLEKRHPGEYKATMMGPEHYDTLITDSAMVLGPDGEFIAAFLKRAIPMPVIAPAWSVLRDFNPKTDNRGSATGVKMVPRKKKDGTMQKTLRTPKGDEVISGVVGFMDRYVRIPYCRACSFNAQNPDKYAALVPLFREVDRVHRELDPAGWAHGKAHADKTKPEWLIPGTSYTTVTINKNFRTAAHLDAANLHDGTCAMLLIREGKFEGGNVVFPEWRFAVAMDTSDVVIFRNMKDFHGNTAIVGKSKNYQRCTLVHYFREAMLNCGSLDEELERAKRRQPGDPIRSDRVNPAAQDSSEA